MNKQAQISANLMKHGYQATAMRVVPPAGALFNGPCRLVPSVVDVMSTTWAATALEVQNCQVWRRLSAACPVTVGQPETRSVCPARAQCWITSCKGHTTRVKKSSMVDRIELSITLMNSRLRVKPCILHDNAKNQKLQYV